MKNLFYIISIIILTSCQNWNYTKLYYPKSVELEPIHVHLYNHYNCEWSCLNLDENNHVSIDSVSLKYKTNKNAEITKLRIIIHD